MIAQDFINKYTGRFIDFELFTSSKSGKVNTNVTSSVSQHKIFHSIITMVSVYVMDNVTRFKLSTEVSI